MTARGAGLAHATRLTRTIWQGNERRQDIGDGKLDTGAEAQRGKPLGLQSCAVHERSSETEQ